MKRNYLSQLTVLLQQEKHCGKNCRSEKSYIYIDTGAMYRAITLAALNQGVDLEDEQALDALLKNTVIELVSTDEGQKYI